jgi:hypothetical protein
VYADFLRIVLEVLNTVITAGLPHNPELVYALLHRQEVFTPFEVRLLTLTLAPSLLNLNLRSARLAHASAVPAAVRARGERGHVAWPVPAQHRV